MLTATIREIFTRPSAWIYLLIVFGGMASGAAVAAWSPGLNTTHDVSILAMPADLATIVIIVGSAMLASSAHARGHIGYAYLAKNNRGAENILRIALVVGALVLAGVLGMVAGYLGLTALGTNVDLATLSDRANASGYIWSGIALWGVLGTLSAATAIVLRSGVGALVLWIADFFIIEASLAMISADWARHL